MARILLDTHAVLWFLGSDTRLPFIIRQQIEEAEQATVSIISLWEIAIKVAIGKLTPPSAFEAIEANLVTLNIAILPVTFEDTIRYISLPLHHRDPFDRILVAQAMNCQLALVSRDKQFDAYPIQRLWS